MYAHPQCRMFRNFSVKKWQITTDLYKLSTRQNGVNVDALISMFFCGVRTQEDGQLWTEWDMFNSVDEAIAQYPQFSAFFDEVRETQKELM